ncbi:hypothetical protein ACTFIW_008814 [Dictyostelium discoideum]
MPCTKGDTVFEIGPGPGVMTEIVLKPPQGFSSESPESYAFFVPKSCFFPCTKSISIKRKTSYVNYMPFQLFLFCIIASLILSSAYSVESSSAIESASHAGACIVINGQTWRVLFQKNEYAKRFPESCTKVATLAYVLASPYCDIKKKIIVPKEA